ncbi:hypothetical protein [Algibacter sp.]|uniref:hypothetical protein n=1 Tax=Algibacter sp. TaxID=1872428 RepID=UPI003C7119B8
MKYLTPEIEALLKNSNFGKSLARTNVSCGIFQDCDYNEERPKLFQPNSIEKTKEKK